MFTVTIEDKFSKLTLAYWTCRTLEEARGSAETYCKGEGYCTFYIGFDTSVGACSFA